MTRSLPMAAALILIVAAGIVHGRWTQRWSVSHAIEGGRCQGRSPADEAGRLARAKLELDRAQLTMAEIAGYVARRYEDRRGGDAVTILLVCGARGRSRCTPDIATRG